MVRNCKPLPPLIRHGLRHATFPQGKAIFASSEASRNLIAYTPSVTALP